MASKHVKYGWASGPGKGVEVPMTAGYLHRRGGHWVSIDAAGNATICNASETLPTAVAAPFGWAVSPKDTAGANSWAAASGDKVFVITGKENKFWMPIDKTSASANATVVGKVGNITVQYSAATMIQKLNVTTAVATRTHIVYDYDTENDLVLVGLL